MNTKPLLVFLAIIALLVVVLMWGVSTAPKPADVGTSPTPTPVRTTAPVAPVNSFCTMDAKMCPDGSYVGRVGPNCEFALCPAGTPGNNPSGIFVVGFGGRAGGGNLVLIPREIVEDSRCPSDVQCIQAGTVRVRADVVYNRATTTQVVQLSMPLEFGNTTVTLTDVAPVPHSQQKIAPASYRFTFTFVP